jgi:hypothetical protein
MEGGDHFHFVFKFGKKQSETRLAPRELETRKKVIDGGWEIEPSARLPVTV